MWVVADSVRDAQAGRDGRRIQHLVSLVSVEDDATGEELDVVWEIEAGTKIIEQAELPAIAREALDDPAELDAFLNAVRWGAVTSADQRALQAPFRSGITIEDYQLEPLVRALRMPRTTLLVADDVGLGKTIEAGLVVQELLLRHRARSALVVCPAALQVQWRDELREKFGLEFRIVDRALLGYLRRARGVGANPFAHFPRLIVSIDWLKGELGMRLLREVLPPHPEIPRRYDILIVDEVHNCAPAGAGGAYARDTLRTAAIRTLAPHCEHRLFLSATPHNGYENSFAALLELLDPHRFARGIRPQPEATREVTVRRLKQDLKHADGSPRFPAREIVMLEVEHPDDERAVHANLVAYGAARARRLHGDDAGQIAADFVVTLLKKRLFSSPAAFRRTLEVHRATITGAARKTAPPPPKVLLRMLEDAQIDEEEDAGSEALAAAASAERSRPSAEELELLDLMQRWAERAAVSEDARTTRLLDWVQEHVKADRRVIVFTEYRATQRYLQERLAARRISGERVALLDGTTDEDQRERIKALWQEPLDEHPMRVLLATDAASEGISLQRRCNLLAHAEIPWNPNRLEQRNGRVDRHGQPADAVYVHHCVSSGWEDAERGGSLEGDLDFLARVVRKVQQIREDLGSAAPVIAGQVEEAMLGRRRRLDESRLGSSRALRTLLSEDRRMSERLARLRDELQESRTSLQMSPARIERVVQTALRLARQPALEPADEPGTFHVPALTGSWAHEAEDLPLRRRVALKVLAPEFVEDSTARARFQREIDHAVAMEHPHVVPVYSAGFERPYFYIAMRLIPGHDLRDVTEASGPLPEQRALTLIGQIASALYAMHRKGLVHRDVKPHNVLLWGAGEEDEHALLTDFGIAKALHESRGAITGPGTVAGTPAYMAPEVCLLEAATPASDQYSLAITAFELVAGELPLQGDAVSFADAHVKETPLRLRDVVPSTTMSLSDAIDRALAKDPRDRYPDVRQFVRATRTAEQAFRRSEAVSEVVVNASGPVEAASRLLADPSMTDDTISRAADIDKTDVVRLRRQRARSALVGRRRR
jgi:superfamily II DNA or RNA helicase